MSKKAKIKSIQERTDSDRGGVAILDPPAQVRTAIPYWMPFVVASVFGFILFNVYGPALSGPFVFDDFVLPFRLPGFAERPLQDWISSVRPLLMLTYWFNYQVSGIQSTFSYHLTNLAIHVLNAVLVFVVTGRLLLRFGMDAEIRKILAGFSARLFLLHPLQTQSVAYIAGRSESLSALFFLAAYAVFLDRRRESVSWRVASTVLLLFGCAAITKEHTVTLAGVLLLTDFFVTTPFSLQGISRNWRLYAPMAVAGALATIAAFRVLSLSASAGFSLPGLTWYEYLLTEFRAIVTYIRLFFVPVGQTIDYDFPISHTLLEYGSWAALLALVALLGLALYHCRRYPIACFGFLFFLVTLAPTSSFIPIKDPIAEHRMYLPMLGLTLVSIDFLSRLRVSAKTLKVSLMIAVVGLAILSHARARLWGNPEKLWANAVHVSPAIARPYGNLASIYLRENRCQEAKQLIETNIGRIREAKNSYLITTWGLALDCLNEDKEAIVKFEEASSIQPTAQVQAILGRLYLEAGRLDDSGKALDRALQLDPNWEMTHVYKGQWHASRQEYQAAAASLRKALALNPNNQRARELLVSVGGAGT